MGKDNKKMAMMNSDKAKKVACYLEMICRGIVQRIFGAMKRYRFMAKQLREEEERLAALLADKHSQSLQRLKIYLSGKEKRMLYGGFRWWQNCTVNSKFGIMEREVDRARKARIADIQKQKAQLQGEANDLTAEIDAAKAKLAGLKDALTSAQEGRRNDKLETTRLLGDLEKINADKDDLEKEMALIVDQIGFLSEYSSKKAK